MSPPQIPEFPYTAEWLMDKFTKRHTRHFENPPDTLRFPNELLRVYRAIRWLGRAEKENDSDPDVAFILHWIAFNAAYARDMPGERFGEASEFRTFIESVCEVDEQNVIENYVTLKVYQPILNLVGNQYVFRDFWDYRGGDIKAADWEDKLIDSIRRTGDQLGRGDTVGALTTLLDRLYVLRNQLVHGGATWNSSVNRSQVEDGAEIMGFLVPVIIDLMMDNDDVFDAPPHFPVV